MCVEHVGSALQALIFDTIRGAGHARAQLPLSDPSLHYIMRDGSDGTAHACDLHTRHCGASGTSNYDVARSSARGTHQHALHRA